MTEINYGKFLIKTDAARRAIAEAKRIDELKDIRDKAEAVRQYARQAKLGVEMINDCTEIKLRAERRMGELLKETEKNKGTRGQLRSDIPVGGKVSIPPTDMTLTLADLGVSKAQSSRAQRLAEVPEKDFEKYISETKVRREELTTTGVLQTIARNVTPEPAITPPMPDGKYRCIIIDPPWPIEKIEREERPNQGKKLDYPIMSLDEIASLPIGDLAMENGCHLYLWITHKFLPDGLKLINGWGFRYQCLLTWVKPTGITPYSWMYNTEHIIFAKMGSLPLEKLGIKLSFDAKVEGHSVKPNIFYDIVRRASPGPRLEMFSRKPRDEFEVWGNEI